MKPPQKRPDPKDRKCDWAGCKVMAQHRAPIAPDRGGEQWFCLPHAREFNRSWNFFSGMTEDQVREYQEASLTGHRPTWAMGSNGASAKGGPDPEAKNKAFAGRFADPFEIMPETPKAPPRERTRPKLTKAQAKALETFNLDETATSTQIKGRYKELVKRFHPDANGGDNGAVERLRSVIRAYQVLKNAPFAREKRKA